MKQCLVDVSVFLALLVPRHPQHRIALRWFDGLLAGQAGLCRFVQLALVRLLANPSVMGGYALTTDKGWGLVADLLLDERVRIVTEPEALVSVLPAFLKQRAPYGKLVGDAYLAAFALASGRAMVTLDGGFEGFRGLELELLA